VENVIRLVKHDPEIAQRQNLGKIKSRKYSKMIAIRFLTNARRGFFTPLLPLFLPFLYEHCT
jgi:hypothetical protein